MIGFYNVIPVVGMGGPPSWSVVIRVARAMVVMLDEKEARCYGHRKGDTGAGGDRFVAKNNPRDDAGREGDNHAALAMNWRRGALCYKGCCSIKVR